MPRTATEVIRTIRELSRSRPARFELAAEDVAALVTAIERPGRTPGEDVYPVVFSCVVETGVNDEYLLFERKDRLPVPPGAGQVIELGERLGDDPVSVTDVTYLARHHVFLCGTPDLGPQDIELQGGLQALVDDLTRRGFSLSFRGSAEDGAVRRHLRLLGPELH